MHIVMIACFEVRKVFFRMLLIFYSWKKWLCVRYINPTGERITVVLLICIFYFLSRMVVMFIDADGGKCEFQHLGVTLDVPRDSIDNVELQISCVAPSDKSLTRRPLRLAFGDFIVSDIIKIGPDGQSFRRPVFLSIPYSVYEVPLGRRIEMKCFDEEESSWESIPVQLSNGTYF